MISDSLLRKNRITALCEHSRDVTPGFVFDSIEFAEKPLSFSDLSSRKIIYVGSVSEEEMLFRTDDGRNRFSSLGGCGSEDGKLYCVAAGLFFDFGHLTDDANVIDECSAINGNADYHTSCGALLYAEIRKALNKIIKVQRNIQLKIRND